MSVLSAGLNTTGVKEFPARLNMVLALQVEMGPEDGENNWLVRVRLRQRDVEEAEILAQIDATISGRRRLEKYSYVSLPINLAPLSVPGPGEYAIEVDVGTLPTVVMTLYVRQVGQEQQE